MFFTDIEYNTDRPYLIIPEYGRHIQKMVDQAVAEQDPEKRNNQAKSIISVMGNLNPHLRDVADFNTSFGISYSSFQTLNWRLTLHLRNPQLMS